MLKTGIQESKSVIKTTVGLIIKIEPSIKINRKSSSVKGIDGVRNCALINLYDEKLKSNLNKKKGKFTFLFSCSNYLSLILLILKLRLL